jgi:hypothetical protein
MSGDRNEVRATFSGDERMDLSEFTEDSIAGLDEDQINFLETVGATVTAYIRAAQELLAGPYAHVRDSAPVYLSDPGNVLITCCSDGISIRFESRANDNRVIAAFSTESLFEVVPKLSQYLIYCHKERLASTPGLTEGLMLTLFSESPEGLKQDMASVAIAFHALIEPPKSPHIPPNKPFCPISVRNEVEMLLHLRPVEPIKAPDELVVVRKLVRLPVGWDCIEVYPSSTVEQWRPEYASSWAERDILAAVLARQLNEARYRSLDPNALARQKFGMLLKEFKDLLDSNPEREETLQEFLAEHPTLLCPAHDRIWPKLPLGARKTDFVIRDAIGDYLLVELERSTYRLFLKDGHPSKELNHAKGQVIDWKRYLEDNLSTAQRELDLTGISINPKSLIVMGRSRLLTDENRRKLISIENDSPRLKIMTYDDLYDNAKAVIENLLGPVWVVGGDTQIYYLENPARAR